MPSSDLPDSRTPHAYPQTDEHLCVEVGFCGFDGIRDQVTSEVEEVVQGYKWWNMWKDIGNELQAYFCNR